MPPPAPHPPPRGHLGRAKSEAPEVRRPERASRASPLAVNEPLEVCTSADADAGDPSVGDGLVIPAGLYEEAYGVGPREEWLIEAGDPGFKVEAQLTIMVRRPVR